MTTNILKNGMALGLLVLSAIGCNKETTDPNFTDGVAATSVGTVNATTLSVEKAKYYVAPNGNDANPGTIDKPFKSWDKVLNLVKPGDLVYLRGGVYSVPSNKQTGAYLKGKNGSPGNLIRFWAYPGEVPILDCGGIKVNNNLSGVEFMGNYWHFKGIDVRNLPQPRDGSGHGLFCVAFSVQNSNNNIFENILVHHNGCIGFYLGENSSGNVFLNCDSHDNYDLYTYDGGGNPYSGGNADGFHITLNNSSATNTFRGCRAWCNSDDGYDCWQTESTVVFDHCWSFWNGFQPGTSTPKGDGEGFKLGETYNSPDGTYHRMVTDCVAFQNREHGFDQSDAHCQMLFENNTAFGNRGLGFYIEKFNLKNKFKNNIAVGNCRERSDKNTQVLLTSQADNSNNSWNVGGDASQFVSTDNSGMDHQRNPDESIPACNFLRLKSNSSWIDRGINVGISFLGSYPDLGAFEMR